MVAHRIQLINRFTAIGGHIATFILWRDNELLDSGVIGILTDGLRVDNIIIQVKSKWEVYFCLIFFLSDGTLILEPFEV